MCPQTSLSSRHRRGTQQSASHLGSQHSHHLSRKGGLGWPRYPHAFPVLSLDIPCDARPDSCDPLCSCSRGFSSSGLLKGLSVRNRLAEESPY